MSTTPQAALLSEQELLDAWSKHTAVSGYETYTLREHVLRAMRDVEQAIIAKLQATQAKPTLSDDERVKALQYCDEVELQIMEVANGKRKPAKVEFQPIGRLIEFIRNGKTYDVSLSYNPDATHQQRQDGGEGKA